MDINPFDFTCAQVDHISSSINTLLLSEKIDRQLRENALQRRNNHMHIAIMRTLWDEMCDKGNQLLPKDVRGLADKLVDELERL